MRACYPFPVHGPVSGEWVSEMFLVHGTHEPRRTAATPHPPDKESSLAVLYSSSNEHPDCRLDHDHFHFHYIFQKNHGYIFFHPHHDMDGCHVLSFHVPVGSLRECTPMPMLSEHQSYFMLSPSDTNIVATFEGIEKGNPFCVRKCFIVDHNRRNRPIEGLVGL